MGADDPLARRLDRHGGTRVALLAAVYLGGEHRGELVPLVLLGLWQLHYVNRALRREHEGYVVPERGPFRWITSPNYAGEIVEWLGWAILTWSPAGLAFAVFTFANLAPRALANRRWYLETFPGFPPERKALIPRVL